MTEATQPWAGFKYVPVRGLADRRISRYLRTQRKNMRRFFAEHGLFDLLARMDEIRKSRQGMMAKNTMFQEVLNDYAERVNQPAATGPATAGKTGAASQPEPEAAPVESGVGSVVVQSKGTAPDGAGVDGVSGVPEVAGIGGDGRVIEE